MALPNTSLSWIQDGEPMNGGSSGNSGGLLNRTSVELLENDAWLENKKVANSEIFEAAEIITINTVCKLSAVGAIIATNDTEIRSSGLLMLSLEPIVANETGEFLLLGKVPMSHAFDLGATLYLGIDGAITDQLPITYVRIIGYALDSSIFFNGGTL